MRLWLSFVFAFLVGSYQAIAADVWHSAKIKQVYPLSQGDFILTFEQDSPACLNGNTPKYYYVAVGQNGVTADALKNLLSVSLAAAAQRKTVVINFNDQSTACYINRLSVDFSD